MRDHRKLRAFELADALTLAVYGVCRRFPTEEQFGLTAQMRRAAASVVSNIVERCARRTEADYLHFLHMAYGSAQEVSYHISLAHRLGYLDDEAHAEVSAAAQETCKVLAGLIGHYRG